MKKLLLAGTAALALLGAVPAKAQFFGFGGVTVFDPTNAANMATTIGKLAEEIGIQSDSLTNLIQILETGVQTYQQLVQLYQLTQIVEQDIHHLTNANSLAAALNALTNSLATTSGMPTALTGNGGFGNDADGWAAQYYNQNVVYLPQSQDAVAMRMPIDAQWVANAQGAATNNLQNLEQRVAGMADLQNCVDTSPTIQDQGACNSRLAYENVMTANQNAQAVNLLINANAQRDAAQQWQEQQNRYQLDVASANLCGYLAGLGTAYVSSACGGAAPTLYNGGGGTPVTSQLASQ